MPQSQIILISDMTHPKPILKINTLHLSHNARHVMTHIGDGCEMAATVKANGYGLGMTHIIPPLIEVGVTSFFVAREHEAYELDDILPENQDFKIFIYNALPPFDYKGARHRFIPVLNSLKHVKDINPAQACLLHVDTGMNRLGISRDELRLLFEEPAQLKRLNLYGVMSHFVSSEMPNDPLSCRQFETFKAVIQRFKDLGFEGLKFSICNSGGVFHDPAFHLDMVRPGIALYGGVPLMGCENPMKPVAYLEAPIQKIFTLKAGETIGYNATYTVKADMDVATLQLGYADGIFRSLSNKGTFYYKGQPCPILGRISMDLISVGLEHCKLEPKAGEMIEILGDNQTIDDLARDVGTISYEIITSLGQRFEREII